MLKTNRGFSLIELMVVVAIIGILATIAVPSVNKYMAKARQSEAKSNLSSIYTSNKAFYAEFNIYDDRFAVIGYAPEGKLHYNVGFAAGAECVPLTAAGYTAPLPVGKLASIDAVGYCGTNGAFTNGCSVLADGNLNPAIPGTGVACVAGGVSTFIAGATGRISASAALGNDQWTMNQDKSLANVNDGTQ